MAFLVVFALPPESENSVFILIYRHLSFGVDEAFKIKLALLSGNVFVSISVAS